MLRWQEDFTYWFFEGEELMEASTLSQVPEWVEDYANIWDAVSFFQKCGCVGRSAHQVETEFHRLCLAVLEQALSRYGERLQVFRGSQSEGLPLELHELLYGATNYDVAAWYGPVSTFDVFGLRTYSSGASVLEPGDLSSFDEEVIFFPHNILQEF